jgi:outer membrane biosynthesis protein TonB
MTMQRDRLRSRPEAVRGSLPAGIPAHSLVRSASTSPAAPSLLYWRPVLVAAAFSTLFVGGIILAILANPTARTPDEEPDAGTVAATAPDTPARDKPEAAEEVRPHEEAPLAAARPAAVQPAEKSSEPPVEKPAPPARTVARETPPAPPVPADEEPPAQEPPEQEPVTLPRPQPVVAKPPRGTETFETSVAFACNPAAAARQAREQQKLLLVLHVSGDFEESRFT